LTVQNVELLHSCVCTLELATQVKPKILGGVVLPSIVKTIKDKQLHWASARGIAVDESGYTRKRCHHLFVTLSDESLAEFDGANGGELGKKGERGKIQALHSSSALAVNAFEFQRERDKSALASAMGLSSARTDVEDA
jgi:hypothetical protein